MSEQNNHAPLRINEQIVIQYLLGELPEAWQVHLEELLFIDPACYMLLKVAEENLIDEYVSGELSVERRERFETRYLVSERRRQKVAFACALKQTLADFSTPARPEPARWKHMLLFWRTGPAALRYTFAGLILSILIGGAWLAVVMTRSRTQQAQPQTDLATILPREQANKAAPQSKPTAIAASPEGRPPQSEARPSSPPKSSESAPNRLAVVTQTLKPGRVRDIEPQPDERARPSLLHIPSGTRLIRLRLEVRSEPKFPAYHVLLMTAEGQSIRLPKHLRLTPGKNGHTIVVELPAILSARGDYVLTLLGVDDGGGAEELGDYYFTVLER